MIRRLETALVLVVLLAASAFGQDVRREIRFPNIQGLKTLKADLHQRLTGLVRPRVSTTISPPGEYPYQTGTSNGALSPRGSSTPIIPTCTAARKASRAATDILTSKITTRKVRLLDQCTRGAQHRITRFSIVPQTGFGGSLVRARAEPDIRKPRPTPTGRYR